MRIRRQSTLFQTASKHIKEPVTTSGQGKTMMFSMGFLAILFCHWWWWWWCSTALLTIAVNSVENLIELPRFFPSMNMSDHVPY